MLFMRPSCLARALFLYPRQGCAKILFCYQDRKHLRKINLLFIKNLFLQAGTFAGVFRVYKQKTVKVGTGLMLSIRG